MDWKRATEDNLTSLVELDERTLLESVKRRSLSGRIYTDVGDILLAVNPFKKLPIYSEEWSKLYSGSQIDDLSPHIFGVAAKAFTALLQTKKDQVCVISGESGAGKTESTKHIIHQLMKMCKSSQIGAQLQNKIIQLNPVLEAFGNAKTLLNDNSSRFGKFIQLMFTSNGRIVGGGLDQYLLEKSRVCVQGDGECNYHIFYYIFNGLHPDTAKELVITSPESYRYMCSHKAVKSTLENRQKFFEVTQSMKDIGFVDEEINQVVTTLAAILHIGNIEFKNGDSTGDSSYVDNMDKAEIVSRLLKIEHPEDLCFALTTLRTTTRGETVDKLYSPSKAADVRDALAKGLYSRMFAWLVSRINNYIAPQTPGSYTGIGILDIFGFEIFKVNSFEQFCINIANEQLQQYFNTQIFAMEKEEYIKEGVAGVEISYQDNQPVLELFLSRPLGLISLLDEQCRTNGSESRLLERYRQVFVSHPNYKPNKGNALLFTVQHYAGKVEYCVEGFLDKNRDSLPEPVQGVLKFSGLRLIRTLFTNYPNFSGSVLRSTSRIKPSQRSVLKKMSVRRKKSSRNKGRGERRKVMTVSGHFRESLQKLMERILSATPHFVRCFKPNSMKLPSEFDDEFVLKQLKYTGMLEAVRVRREGFAYRPFFSDFVCDYKQIAYKMTDATVHSSQETCQKILKAAGIVGWKIGRSRVFLRYFHEEKLNRMLLEMENKAMKIQAAYRGYRVRKIYKPLCELARKEKTIVGNLLKNVSQHSEDNFQRIVELNKIDVLLAIERFGHPNEGCGNNANTREPEQQRERKFKPKAVGGVAILIDSQIADKLALRSNRQITEASSAPQQNTSIHKKVLPSVQPRKFSKEENEGFLSPKEKENNLDLSNDNDKTVAKIKQKRSDCKVAPLQRVSREKDHLFNPVQTSPTEEGKITAAVLTDSTSKPGQHGVAKKKPPPVLPRPNRKMECHPVGSPHPLTGKTQERMKRHSDETMDRNERLGNNSHLSVSAEKRSQSVSPSPRRHNVSPINPNSHCSDSSSSERSSSRNEELCYFDIDSEMSALDSPFKSRKPLIGGIKLSSNDEMTAKSHITKSQLTPETPPTEYKLKFETKKDSVTAIGAPPPTGTLVTPNSVQTYTIQTSLERLIDSDEEYVEIIPSNGSKNIESDDDDEEYVLPFVHATISKRFSDEDDDIIYANCQQSKSVDDLIEYVNINGYSVKERKSSLDSKLPSQVSTQDAPSNGRSRSLNATYKSKINSTFTSKTHTNLQHQSGLSNSVPDLLSATKSTVSPTGSVERLFLNGDKGLSLDSPLLHRVSVLSTDSSDSRNSTPSFNKQKKKFGNLFKRKKYVDRNGDVPKDNLADSKDPMGSTNLGGYMPGITNHNANKMLSGQLPGAYIIFTDYSKNGNFIFKLAVSQGKGKLVWSCDIEPQQRSATGESGLSLRCGNGDDSQFFLNLQSLSTYYRYHPLNKAGLRLTTPVQIKTLPKEDKLKKKKPVPLPVKFYQ